MFSSTYNPTHRQDYRFCVHRIQILKSCHFSLHHHGGVRRRRCCSERECAVLLLYIVFPSFVDSLSFDLYGSDSSWGRRNAQQLNLNPQQPSRSAADASQDFFQVLLLHITRKLFHHGESYNLLGVLCSSWIEKVSFGGGFYGLPTSAPATRTHDKDYTSRLCVCRVTLLSNASTIPWLTHCPVKVAVAPAMEPCVRAFFDAPNQVSLYCSCRVS